MWNLFKGKTNKKHRSIKKDTSLECKVDWTKCFKSGDKPLKPIIARAGGKTQLVPTILKKAPSHKTYVEPFVGGGAVFLKKPLAEKNVINDKDRDVMKVYKKFKNSDGFNKCQQQGSKKKFERIAKKGNKSACDLAYVSKWSFGSDLKAKRYVLDGNSKKKEKQYGNRYRPKDKTFGIKYQKAHQTDYKDKLKKTTVLNTDYKSVMKRYDGKNTFHYLDPPYVGTEKVYKEHTGVSPEDVCKVAKSMDGKVLISYNDHPRVRKACRGMRFNRVNTRYTLGAKSNNTKAKEVLISNYK